MPAASLACASPCPLQLDLADLALPHLKVLSLERVGIVLDSGEALFNSGRDWFHFSTWGTWAGRACSRRHRTMSTSLLTRPHPTYMHPWQAACDIALNLRVHPPPPTSLPHLPPSVSAAACEAPFWPSLRTLQADSATVGGLWLFDLEDSYLGRRVGCKSVLDGWCRRRADWPDPCTATAHGAW